MMLEMIFGHKQFFECDPRHYAKLRFTHVILKIVLIIDRVTQLRVNVILQLFVLIVLVLLMGILLWKIVFLML